MQEDRVLKSATNKTRAKTLYNLQKCNSIQNLIKLNKQSKFISTLIKFCLKVVTNDDYAHHIKILKELLAKLDEPKV